MLLLEPQRVMASQRDRPATPDRVLVERMRSGDEPSLGELYDRHGGAAYSLALVIVGEGADAEEVVADAFGQAWRTAGQFDPARGSVAAWLTTITRTRALDLCRARGRRARAVTRASRENTEGFAVPIAAGETLRIGPSSGARRAGSSSERSPSCQSHSAASSSSHTSKVSPRPRSPPSSGNRWGPR